MSKIFSQSNMLFLQNNWQTVMIIGCVLVVGVYIGLSIAILLRCRKIEGDIGVSAFIPIVSLIQLLKCNIRFSKNLKSVMLTKELEDLENEEIDL